MQYPRLSSKDSLEGRGTYSSQHMATTTFTHDPQSSHLQTFSQPLPSIRNLTIPTIPRMIDFKASSCHTHPTWQPLSFREGHACLSTAANKHAMATISPVSSVSHHGKHHKIPTNGPHTINTIHATHTIHTIHTLHTIHTINTIHTLHT